MIKHMNAVSSIGLLAGFAFVLIISPMAFADDQSEYPATIAALKNHYSAEVTATRPDKKMRWASGKFFSKIVSELKRADNYFVCPRCGSTLVELPEKPCPICGSPASLYKQINYSP